MSAAKTFAEKEGTMMRQLRMHPCLILAALSLPMLATAQQPPQPAPLKVMSLKGNIYWTQGGAGGNTGIIIGQNGVIVVDTKTTVDSSKAVQDEIARITPEPVTTAILTHSDFDHVNGLGGFPVSLAVIAQENCKREMEASTGGRNPAPQDRLPTKTIAKDETLLIEGVRVRLLHFSPAHTSGDLIVFFPDQKVVFTGDLIVTNRPEPLIHLEKKGTAAGWIESVKGLVALDADTYVPGHGDLQTKGDVQKKLTAVQAKFDNIQAMVVQGKSLDEVKTALGESAAPPTPGRGGNLPLPTLTEVIYREVSSQLSDRSPRDDPAANGADIH